MSVLSVAASTDITVMRTHSASILTAHLTVIAWLALVVLINGIVPKLMSVKLMSDCVMRMRFAQIHLARIRVNVKRDIQEME